MTSDLRLISTWIRVLLSAGLSLSSFALGLAQFGDGSSDVAAATEPTTGSPDEFILDLDNRGLPFLIGSYNTTLGYQNYQIMNIEGTTTSDADAGYPGHDLVRDFQGDSSDWWFAPESWNDQGQDLHGFMYDDAAPAGSKYAYFVMELPDNGSSPSYIGRVDNNGIFSHVAHVDRAFGDHAEHEWTMLSNGDLILFESTTGKLLNFGNLRSLTVDYTYFTKGQSPTLTPQSETAAGQEMPTTTFSDTGLPSLLQTAIVDIAGVEHVMVIDSDSLPSVGIHLFNAATLAYVGELDPSASTGLEGEANFWTTTSSPQVEATASIGGDAYLVYSTPDTIPSFSAVFGSYAMGKIAGDQIDLNAMTVTITSHLTDVEMRNRVSLGIQAPATSQTLNLPPALPAISYLVYDENGGQTGTSPDTHTDTTSTDVTVESGIPTYDGYHFTGWNSAADGTGASYDAGDNYTLPAAAGAADYVHAQWAQAASSSLSCSAWAGLIWVQNQYETPTNDYQAANTSQFFMFDAGSGDLDADGLDDASTWVYDDAALGYDLSINATGVDPTSNIMYGTANVDGVAYVASFAPGANPVFYAQGRVDASDVSISSNANGFVDAEGHYWIKDSSGPLYRSQQPLSSYTGYADRNVVTDPMVFDAIGSGDFGSVSDIAVIPTADGYLVAGFVWNDLYWGTWNSTTNTWTSGANASVATGTASPGDYGAVFVDGVTSNGGTLDYSGASIYFTPNAGWDPENAAGRRPVKLAVADALDGITSDDLVLLQSTPTPATGSNDGASMVGCGLQLPDPLGGLHGWMWADIDGDGSRTAVEPTDGMFGDEAVITGYTATVISETDWTTLQGVVAVPAGTRYPATVDADGKWSVDGLAAGADPTGVVQTFKVEFDYTGATMPTDFSPEGYTLEGGTTGTDSDVPVTAGATATSIGGFTVVANTSTHAADAGLVAVPPVDPGSQLDVTWRGECDASNDGTVNFWVDAFSNTSEYDATFELYVNDVLVESIVVQRGGQTAKVWEIVIPYQATFRIDGTIEGETATIETSGNGCEKMNTVVTEEQGGTDVDDLTCIDGGQFTVPAAPTRDGYTFTGWNSAADGTATEYVIGTSYDCAELTIYAVWTQDATTTTTVAPPTTTTVAPPTTTVPPPVAGLAFEPNGGSGGPSDSTGSPGDVVTIPSETPTRPDWVFQGWNTECDGSGASHAAGGQVTLPSSGTLEICAQWAPLLAATPGNDSLANSGSENIPPLSVSLFGMSIALALYSVNQWRRLRLGVM